MPIIEVPLCIYCGSEPAKTCPICGQGPFCEICGETHDCVAGDYPEESP